MAPVSKMCGVSMFGQSRGESEVRTMEKLTRTGIINAPVQKVFQYWEDPTNRPEVWPSLVEIKDVQPLPNGGTSYRWVFKLAGVLLNGTTETSEYVANERLEEKDTGGIESEFAWTFKPENGGTRLTVHVEYTVPIAVLGRLAERLIVKQIEREADTIMANLKAVMEA
jgi:uncharacterized protein YndB with AHSA1/START domain